MPSCAALSCTTRFVKGCGKSFHCFPRDETLRRKWLVNMKREDLLHKKRLSLCSDHFVEECFDRTGQTTRLRDGAVPTLFFFKERDFMKEGHKKKAVKFPFKQLRSGKFLFAPPMYPPLPEPPPPPPAAGTSQDSLGPNKDNSVQGNESGLVVGKWLSEDNRDVPQMIRNVEDSNIYSVYEIAFEEDEETSSDREGAPEKSRDSSEDCFLPPPKPSWPLDPVSVRKRRRINKLLQHDHAYSIGENPVVLKHRLDKACEKFTNMRNKQLRVTHQRNRRLSRRVQRLQEELKELKNNQQAIEETLEFLESLQYRPDFGT